MHGCTSTVRKRMQPSFWSVHWRRSRQFRWLGWWFIQPWPTSSWWWPTNPPSMSLAPRFLSGLGPVLSVPRCFRWAMSRRWTMCSRRCFHEYSFAWYTQPYDCLVNVCHECFLLSQRSNCKVDTSCICTGHNWHAATKLRQHICNIGIVSCWKSN